jgi:putative membrane protein
MIRPAALNGLAAITLALALPAHAQAPAGGAPTRGTAMPPPQAAPGQALPSADYLRMAAQSDEYERQAGQLAMANGSSSMVKDFGRMMVQDHTKSSTDLSQAARTAGLTPPPAALRPDQEQMLTQLRRTSGTEFDRTYVGQQVMAHQEALMLHSNYAAGGQDAPLKAAAAMIVPVVQHHLETVRSMQGAAR